MILNVQSLRKKIILAISVPSVLFISLGLAVIFVQSRILQEALMQQGQIDIVQRSSNLIHNLQIERGTSVNFSKKNIEHIALQKVFDETDKTLSALTEELNEHKENIELVNKLAQIKEWRSAVQNYQIKANDIVKNYSTMIATLLQSQIEMSEKSTISNVKSKIRSLVLLEEMKEQGGMLRAKVTGVFAENIAIDIQRLADVSLNYQSLKALSNSKSLILDREEKAGLEAIFTAKEFLLLEEHFTHLRDNYLTANFAVKSDVYFKNITEILNQIKMVIDSQSKKIETDLKKEIAKCYSELVAVLFLSLGVVLAFYLFRSVMTSLHKAIETLKEIAFSVTSVSEQVTLNNSDTLDGIEKQTIAVQSTASAATEINSLAHKNAELSAETQKKIHSGQDLTNSAMNSLKDLTNSMSEIVISNKKVADQTESSYRDFDKIIKIISNISEKTTVINDVVFQTKLLSFNASVEAARAGEHGKGFSVVAAEIGNLAKMSGEAAAEINQMLGVSVNEVKTIVSTNGNEIQKIIKDSDKTLTQSKDTMVEFENIFKDVVNEFSGLDEIAQHIALAAKEQAVGVDEINKSIAEIDAITILNSKIAKEAQSISTNLTSKIQNLADTMAQLIKLIDDRKKHNNWQQMTIAWSPNFETGNEFVDKDHKTLIEKLNNFLIALDTKNKAVSLEKLDEIIEFAVAHFKREENYMEKIDYDHFTHHINAHVKIAQKVVEFREKMKHDKADIAEFIRFFTYWLVTHIDQEDKAFVNAGTKKNTVSLKKAA